MKKKTAARDFADSLKDNPKEIINWIDSEIREYKKLRIIISKTLKNEK